MIKVFVQTPISDDFCQLADGLGLTLTDNRELSDFILFEDNGLIALSPSDKSQGGAIYCDFLSSEFQRYLNSVSRKSLIAKACGLKNGRTPTILDISTGLGKDAISLANLGAKVTMVETNPYIYLMLYAGVRALKQSKVSFSSEIELLSCQDAMELLAKNIEAYDVVYFDPMFPERKKSAKVKKAMQYFHQVVGEDHNNPCDIFSLASKQANERLVIKRPKGSGYYAEKKPNYSLESKVIRFDIYLK
ncbi:MAG: class I SAM-dependent methyltransferase [Cellvibrionales bacterium]|nr:class I SAM-dependent methyltransferase [Cellvibrionales bacterium]